MREWSLSDEAVIAKIHESFVPVWINVTKGCLPDAPGVAEMKARWDATEGKPLDRWLLRTFHVSSRVVSSDGRELLTPPSMHKAARPREYLEMLDAGLARSLSR